MSYTRQLLVANTVEQTGKVDALRCTSLPSSRTSRFSFLLLLLPAFIGHYVMSM